MTLLAVALTATLGVGPLKVCADPNNLPFSNARGEGFENRIAELVAKRLGTSVDYTWRAQRRGFVRETLGAGVCDIIIGITPGVGGVKVTRPYYRAGYAMVVRNDRQWRPRSLDDPLLAALRIGVHVIGDDQNMLPPARALARRGHVRNVVGYSIYGDYRDESPPSRLVDAVRDGAVDVALVWGPLAGFYAHRLQPELIVMPLPDTRDAGVPFFFGIGMGVRPDDETLFTSLERIIAEEQGAISAILEAYAVPRA